MEALEKIWEFTLLNIPGGSPLTIGHLLLVVLLILGGYLLIQLIQVLITRRLKTSNLRQDVVPVIQRVSFYVVVVIVALAGLSILGLPIGVFAFATGSIAIGVGFGAQNIINNFISGWILIAERPIRPGDFIELDGAYGTFEEVGTRSTLIRRNDGVHLLVPNSKLLENTVVNWTLIDRKIRTSIRVGVAYGSDVVLVNKLIEQAVTENSHVLTVPEPEFIFEDFGDSALIFDGLFWCDVSGEKSLRRIRSDIRFEITRLFEENGIVIAFPQQDVHLFASQPLSVTLNNK